MAGRGSLLIMLLTLAFSESRPPNSARTVYRCEDGTSGLTCENYPGIIEILNVKFPKENADVCNNFNSISKNKRCLASESDEQRLVTELGKICDGKRSCNIHLAHGIYGGIHLPCRDLNISIRIEILYDCIYAPWPVISTPTHSSKEPPKTKTSTVSLTKLPSFPSTNNMAETSTPVSTTRIAGEATVTAIVSQNATETGDDGRRWTRRRPVTCNLTYDIFDDDDDYVKSNASKFLGSFALVIVSFTWPVIFVEY